MRYNATMSGRIPTFDEIDELHRKLAPSQRAYDLIHTHCVIVADITGRLVRRQNALFVRRCTLPPDAPERSGTFAPVCVPEYEAAIEASEAAGIPVASETAGNTIAMPEKSETMLEVTQIEGLVPASEGVTGGTIPPWLLDEHTAILGALLHDIGTYLVLDPDHDGSDDEPTQFIGPRYIEHGLLGYQWLLEQGIDESIAQFARNHTGVGLTREQVVTQNLPLPSDDYSPMNLEQEVVMVADKYHSKSNPPKFLTAERYARKAARFGEENRKAWLEVVKRYGVPDVYALAEKYHQRVAE